MQGLSAHRGNRLSSWIASSTLLVAIVWMALGSVPAVAQKGGPKSVAPLADELIEAVVNVSTSQSIKGPEGLPLPKVPKDSPYHEYFDDFFDNKNGQSPSDRTVSSLGSGFIIDGKEGIVVTNNHVIDGAEEIIVNLHDGRKLKAVLLGNDPKTDIALLKVKVDEPLKEVKFGSSANLRVGDWVMAIGNPFGLGGTVTVGIISAKARNINSGPYDDYLQTDASINKGNSGGPLFNMDGEVIGVNTAIISPTGGSIGIGFAVPADTVVPVVRQLRQFHEVRRGWLGVKIQSVTKEIASSLGIPQNTGAIVAAVTPDGPAAKGAVQAGDVILRFDGQDVEGMRSLPRLVANTPIDKVVDVEVLRKGKHETLKVTIGRLEDDEGPPPGVEQRGDDEGAAPSETVLGLNLSMLTDALRSKYGLSDDIKGAVVNKIEPDSPAAAKIKVGDVIVEASSTPVSEPSDLAKLVESLKKTKRKSVTLQVEDAKGSHRFVSVPVE